jgi:hypothetical protein
MLLDIVCSCTDSNCIGPSEHGRPLPFASSLQQFHKPLSYGPCPLDPCPACSLQLFLLLATAIAFFVFTSHTLYVRVGLYQRYMAQYRWTFISLLLSAAFLVATRCFNLVSARTPLLPSVVAMLAGVCPPSSFGAVACMLCYCRKCVPPARQSKVHPWHPEASICCRFSAACLHTHTWPQWRWLSVLEAGRLGLQGCRVVVTVQP